MIQEQEITLPNLILEWAKKEYQDQVHVAELHNAYKILIGSVNYSKGLNCWDIFVTKTKVWYWCRISCLNTEPIPSYHFGYSVYEKKGEWIQLLHSDPNFFSNLKRAVDRNIKIKLNSVHTTY